MLTIWGNEQSARRHKASRRDFLKVGTLGFGGLTLADLLRVRARASEAATPPKSVIMILLDGGPSHIDMYDMKPDAPVEIRGEFRPMRTNVPGFDICELMPEQARIADKLALVRNLQMRTSSHNHQEVATGFLFDRRIPGFEGVPRPAFGSVISRLRGSGVLPPFVNLWSNGESAEDPAYLGLAHKPFLPRGEAMQNMTPLQGVTQQQLADRRSLLGTFDGLRRDLDARFEGVDAFTARALDIIVSPQVREAFDISREPQRLRDRYGLRADLSPSTGNYQVLSQFLMARRLVEAGVSIVSLRAFSEWDTHASNFPTLRRMVPVVDRGLAALVDDLAARGLDQQVAVVMWGEFGRGPRIYSLNGNVPGRDHHGPANFVLFAGGGLTTGQVVGATDARGERPTGPIVRPQNVLATLYRVLGIDPEMTLPDNQGRPMYLLDDRAPIAELV